MDFAYIKGRGQTTNIKRRDKMKSLLTKGVSQTAHDIKIQCQRLSSYDWYILSNLHNTSYPVKEIDKLSLLYKHETRVNKKI